MTRWPLSLALTMTRARQHQDPTRFAIESIVAVVVARLVELDSWPLVYSFVTVSSKFIINDATMVIAA